MRIVPVLRQEISVKYTIPKYIGHLKIGSRHCDNNASDKCFSTDSICWVIYTRQANTHPILVVSLKYLPCL